MSSSGKTLGSQFEIIFGVLKDEHFTQEAVGILENFAKTIFGSTRIKTGTRNGFQNSQDFTQDSIQDSTQDSSQDSTQDSIQDSSNSRNAILVMRIQDSTQDSSKDSIQDSSQDSTQNSIQDSTQDPTQDSSQKSTQDSSKDSTQDSSQDSSIISESANLVSSPVKTFWAKGLNDEHLTQVAMTLGNFAKTMLRSIKRKKKTSARSDVQSIQDSSVASGEIVRRAVNLVSQLKDSSQDSSPQGSTQDYLVTILKNIKKINQDFINALLVIRIQDSSQDSSQDSFQDSSSDSLQDSSSGSANLVSPSNKIIGSNDKIAEHLTQTVDTFGNFTKTILGSTRIKTRSGLQNSQDSSISSREGASGTTNHGFQIDSSLKIIPSSISSDKSYIIDVSNRDKVNLALANFQNLGIKGLKEEHLTQLLTLENFAKRIKSSTKSGFQSRLDPIDFTQDSSQDSIKDSSQDSSQDSIQDSSNARNSQVVSRTLNLRSRIDSILKRIRAMIPSVISSVESDIANSNRNNVINGLPNFFGMFFGCLTAIANEVNRQKCFEEIENLDIQNPIGNGSMGCRVYKEENVFG